MFTAIVSFVLGAYAYRVGMRWWEERQFKKYLELLKDRGFDDDDYKAGGTD